MSNLQDYTAYIEVDTASRLTVAANTLTIASLDTDETLKLTYDFGASYFSGDFEHSLNIKVTVGTGTESCYVWGMSDSIANPIGTLNFRKRLIGITSMSADGLSRPFGFKNAGSYNNQRRLELLYLYQRSLEQVFE